MMFSNNLSGLLANRVIAGRDYAAAHQVPSSAELLREAQNFLAQAQQHVNISSFYTEALNKFIAYLLLSCDCPAMNSLKVLQELMPQLRQCFAGCGNVAIATLYEKLAALNTDVATAGSEVVREFQHPAIFKFDTVPDAPSYYNSPVQQLEYIPGLFGWNVLLLCGAVLALLLCSHVVFMVVTLLALMLMAKSIISSPKAILSNILHLIITTPQKMIYDLLLLKNALPQAVCSCFTYIDCLISCLVLNRIFFGVALLLNIITAGAGLALILGCGVLGGYLGIIVLAMALILFVINTINLYKIYQLFTKVPLLTLVNEITLADINSHNKLLKNNLTPQTKQKLAELLQQGVAGINDLVALLEFSKLCKADANVVAYALLLLPCYFYKLNDIAESTAQAKYNFALELYQQFMEVKTECSQSVKNLAAINIMILQFNANSHSTTNVSREEVAKFEEYAQNINKFSKVKMLYAITSFFKLWLLKLSPEPELQEEPRASYNISKLVIT